jgi:hypothetical protein
MNHLNNLIFNENERIDIMAYDMIYYYWVNADLIDSFDIQLRKRNAFLSKE